MSDQTPDITSLPKKSFLTKTNAIRAGVAALAVAAVVVIVVAVKGDSDEIADAVETLTEA